MLTYFGRLCNVRMQTAGFYVVDFYLVTGPYVPLKLFSTMFAVGRQNRLMKAFNAAKNSSIGLRSEEYGGKYTSFTLASLHICSIPSE
jgi:hypothetical protein